MSDQPDAVKQDSSGKSQIEWAWEFHRNCDQLMHQRLAAFIAAQAMTLGAFTVLSIARFQQGLAPERAPFVDGGRYLIAVFGLVLTLFGWLVTYPMLKRLRFLNEEVLLDGIPIYRRYLEEALRDWPFQRFYFWIIPAILPITQAMLWIGLIVLVKSANISAPTGDQPPLTRI